MSALLGVLMLAAITLIAFGFARLIVRGIESCETRVQSINAERAILCEAEEYAEEWRAAERRQLQRQRDSEAQQANLRG